MVRAYFVLVGASMLSNVGAVADSLSVHGKTYTDVYVIESPSRYYVQFPADGRVESYSKAEAPMVSILPDAARRITLLREWKQNRDARLGLAGTVSPEVAAAQAATAITPRPTDGALLASRPVDSKASVLRSVDSQRPRGSGYIASIALNKVRLRVSLKAILRPINLDYEVRDGIIWISSPESLRHERFEDLETRTYDLKIDGAETLPKIVVNNNGGRAGASTLGSGARTSSAGGGTVAGGSDQFSNISQLFSTIDDRRVGEAPAYIVR